MSDDTVVGVDGLVGDACVEVAAALAAEAVRVGVDALRERKHQQPAVRAALTAHFGDRVLPFEQRLELPGWDAGGILGGVDVLVRRATQPGYTLMMELKWCHDADTLGWTLWDIYKMASARLRPDVDSAFAVVGAPDSFWQADDHCAPIFVSASWTTAELFARFQPDWQNLLLGGPARPSYLPSQIKTILVANVPLLGAWSLRAIRIEPATARLSFTDGWPVSTRTRGVGSFDLTAS